MSQPIKNIEHLITDNLDIWTGAIKKKGAQGRGSSSKIELYGIKKLRELILDLAVRGLLVAQNPNDEPAALLLDKVEIEKRNLVKAKLIKKPIALPLIQDEDKDFQLPFGWEWVRLGNLVEMYNGRAFKSSEWGSSGIPIVRIQNLNNEEAEFNYYEGDISKVNRITDNTFLISWSGTPGTSFGAFIWSRGDAALNQHINKCEFHYKRMNLEFMRLAINGRMNHFISMAQGAVGLKHVTKGTLNSAVIALPPESEQIRIVAKVDELMALCDQLEQQTEHNIIHHQTLVETLLDALVDSLKTRSQDGAAAFQEAWQRIYDNFDVLFTTEHAVEKLKQTILQLAVMGRLVPQDPNDEPASILLEKIAAEKEQLIKDGKIKKQKPLPRFEIDLEASEIPSGWVYTRLGEVMELVSGQHLKPSEYSEELSNGFVPYITGPAEFGEINPSYSKFTGEKRAIALEGDILITCKGSGLGKWNLAHTEMAISRQLMAIRVFPRLDGKYIRLVVDSLYEYFQSKGIGIAIPGISRDDVNLITLGIPPVAEQNRIVAKVDELMALCDRLKERINEMKIVQLKLSEELSVVE